MKEVGVPLTAMGRAAAKLAEPDTGMGAVSPAPTHSGPTQHVCTSMIALPDSPMSVRFGEGVHKRGWPTKISLLSPDQQCNLAVTFFALFDNISSEKCGMCNWCSSFTNRFQSRVSALLPYKPFGCCYNQQSKSWKDS